MAFLQHDTEARSVTPLLPPCGSNKGSSCLEDDVYMVDYTLVVTNNQCLRSSPGHW